MTGSESLGLLASAVDDITAGRRGRAWRSVRRAADGDSTNGLVQLLAARILYLLGDYHAAQTAVARAVALGVESAPLLHYEQARAIGCYHDACAALEAALEAGLTDPPARAGASAAGHRRFDQALEQLVQLYLDHHFNSAAVATLNRYMPRATGSLELHLQQARACARCGDASAARDAVRRAVETVGPTPPEWLQAAAVLLDLGAFDEAATVYASLVRHPAAAPAAIEALGRLCLWNGDLERAAAYADQLCAAAGTRAAGLRMRGALMVLRGEPATALPLLDDALRANPDDGEAYLWRAEAALRLGRRQDTCADADRSLQQGYSFAACVVRMIATLVPTAERTADDGARRGPWGAIAARLRRTTAARPARDDVIWHARQEFRAEMGAMFPNALDARSSHTDLGILLEQALTAMRGNRTPIDTWVDGARLTRLPPSSSPRIVSRLALELLRVAPVDESFRRLDELAAQFPDSSMPMVHRGELQLWLGRYPEARADLEASLAIRLQTRWAWYGLAWLDLLAGNPGPALDTCAHGIRVMDNTEGPVAMILRGEAYRLLGRLDEARDQLQRAGASHPTRVATWVNLALVEHAAGNGAAQAALFDRVAAAAPALISQAATELGDDVFSAVVLERAGRGPAAAAGETLDRVLAHCLVMMRGNRASGLITYFTADGQLRHVPRHTRVDAPGGAGEERTLAKINAVLNRALDSRRLHA